MTFLEARYPKDKPIPAAATAKLSRDNLPIFLRVQYDVEHRFEVRGFRAFAPPRFETTRIDVGPLPRSKN